MGKLYYNKFVFLFWLTKLYKKKTGRPVDKIDISKLPEFDRILILSTTAIGDTLLSTPVVTALREEYPSAIIKLMVRHHYCNFFKNNPDTNDIIPFHKGWAGLLRMWWKIKKENFTIAIVLHTSDPFPVAVSVLSGIPCIIVKSLQPRFDPFFSKFIRPNYDKHAIERRMNVLKIIRPQRTSWPHRLVLPTDPLKTKDTCRALYKEFQLPENNYISIGFQPGASRNFKIWPKKNFIELGKKLLTRDKRIILFILGNAKETPLGKEIVHGIDQDRRVFSLCGKTSLTDLPYVVKGLNLIITNDTGTLHIAIAAGTPTVSLFVPTDPHGTGPFQDLEKHHIIFKKRPCGDDCVGKKCTLSISCMDLIKVDEVFDATLALLSRTSDI